MAINIESHNAEKANNVMTGGIIVRNSQERVQRSEFKGYLRGKKAKGLCFFQFGLFSLSMELFKSNVVNFIGFCCSCSDDSLISLDEWVFNTEVRLLHTTIVC